MTNEEKAKVVTFLYFLVDSIADEMERRRGVEISEPCRVEVTPDDDFSDFGDALDNELTDSQKRAMNEIFIGNKWGTEKLFPEIE